jgi:hypothetical protein
VRRFIADTTLIDQIDNGRKKELEYHEGMLTPARIRILAQERIIP